MPSRALLVRLLLAVALAFSAAGGLVVPRGVMAAPRASALVVTSAADSNAADTGLTLREALLVANGGTGSLGLARGVSPSERAQLVAAGCLITSTTIFGGCGAGLPDTVTFAVTLTVGAVITLTSPLPPISDTQPLTVTGGVVAPTLLAGSLVYNPGLVVNSSRNTISGLGIRGSGQDDFLIAGDYNTLSGVWAWDAGESGVKLTGDYNLVEGAFLGLPMAPPAACGVGPAGRGNLFAGLHAAEGAVGNQVRGSVTACNDGSGFYVSAAAGTLLGPGNWVGTAANQAALGNANAGVFLAAGATATQVFSNTIAYNSVAGLRLTGANGNRVAANTILGNDGPGLEVLAQGQGNVIGGPWLGDPLGGNLFYSNERDGIRLSGPLVTGTVVVGNWVGPGPGGQTAAGNGTGVYVLQARDNLIGVAGAAPNVISGNTGAGLTLEGAVGNQVTNNQIGVSPLGAAQGNGAEGVAVIGGSTRNTLEGNTIAYNVKAGLYLGGTGTTSNTLRLTGLHHNGGDGINEANGAGNNTWSQVSTFANGGLGVDQLGDVGNLPSPDAPRIIRIRRDGDTSVYQVSGLTFGPDGPGSAIELYLAAIDPTGFGEGYQYLATAVAGPDGTWLATFDSQGTGCLTAFQTRLGPGGETLASGEFGLHSCRLYVPLARR